MTDNDVPARWREPPEIHTAMRQQQEYEEVIAVLRALRAANFDLGDRDNADDERTLTQMLQEWRARHERRLLCRQWRLSFIRWLAMFVAGAAVTLFGPDVHQWLKSHWHF